MRKFSFTDLYGIAVRGAFCGPVAVGAFSALTEVLLFWLSFPIAYFLYAPCFGATIVPCQKYRQNVRKLRLTNLYGIAVRRAFCGPVQVVGFLHQLHVYIFGSPSPLLPYHMHPALVEQLHRARSSCKICANFHSRTYTALKYAEHFADPSKSSGFLHQLKVCIFMLSFPIASFSYAPCFGGNVAPC